MTKTNSATYFAKSRIISAALILLFVFTSLPKSAFAQDQCRGCVTRQCSQIPGKIQPDHEEGEPKILQGWAKEFKCYRHWFVGNKDASDCKDNKNISQYFHEHILNALAVMTEEHSALGMQQMMMIGQFFDAKNQLETQRKFQELQVEAHKDYQPSDDFCWFGTNSRSLVSTEEKATYNKLALNAMQMTRNLGTGNASGGQSRDQDKAARWDQYKAKYCDPKDNNWTTPSRDGLFLACGTNSPRIPKRANADIDYHRMIEEPRTLNVDFTNGSLTNPNNVTGNDAEILGHEEDIIALSNNLYGHDVLTRKANQKLLQYQEYQHLYMALRSVAAKRNVAQNTYNSIVAMKASGSEDLSGQGGAAPFMRAIYEELGIPENEMEKLIGKNPSHYAQLEMLSKKIVQNPDFFSNLYDKPANVKRKSVALKAVDLMLDRAVFESEMRQEMVLSVLLSSTLQRDSFREVNAQLLGISGISGLRQSGASAADGGGAP
ncbi:hypothetical protein N9Z27_00800 [Alphaproteobacteria bacterium]|nr:hypothetical protein [Alphaproteobacteria bacterium]